MNKQDKFDDLARFSGSLEAESLALLLKSSDVTFKLIKPPPMVGPRLPWSRVPVVVQVLNKDFNRAKELLTEYRKTQGVPFN